MIRRMQEEDVELVNKLYTDCHPTWPEKPDGWWWAHPTLVLTVGGPLLVGATSFSVSPAPSPELVTLMRRDRPEIGWGHGVYVTPDYRRKGYGWQLAEARRAALKELGVEFFIGMTQPTNLAMQRVFARQGLTRGVTIPKGYPDGSSAILYHGGIR